MTDQQAQIDTTPFVDTPLRQAIRAAFDNPTLANIEAVAKASDPSLAGRGSLRELVAKWRAQAAQIDGFHATMATGYWACADELAALLVVKQETCLMRRPVRPRACPDMDLAEVHWCATCLMQKYDPERFAREVSDKIGAGDTGRAAVPPPPIEDWDYRRTVLDRAILRAHMERHADPYPTCYVESCLVWRNLRDELDALVPPLREPAP